MLQQAFSLSLPILSFMLSFFSVSTADSNVYVQCSQLNFTSMTPYDSNVNSLFTSLVDSASVYNFNKFETSPQSDGVNGLFQCRGDLSSPNCKDCVGNAVSQLKTACPMSAGGQIQLEGCFVKYDNTSFLGAQDEVEVYRRCGPSIGYNSDVLNNIDGLLGRLVGVNGEYFRGGDFGSLLGVAQCVQDLSLTDCQDCLLEASGLLRSECETSSWGDMYLGKCYIRYADQSKEDITNIGNVTNNKTNGGNTNVIDILKWVGGILASLLVGSGTAYCTTKFTYKKIKNKISTKITKDSNNVTVVNNIREGVKEDMDKKFKEFKVDQISKVKDLTDKTKEETSKIMQEIEKAKRNLAILEARNRERLHNLPAFHPYEPTNHPDWDPNACNVM